MAEQPNNAKRIRQPRPLPLPGRPFDLIQDVTTKRTYDVLRDIETAKLDMNSLGNFAVSGHTDGDVIVWDNSSGYWRNQKYVPGPFAVGSAPPNGQQLTVLPKLATDIAFTVQGLVSQTGDLLRVRDSSANALCTIAATGDFRLGAAAMPPTFGDGQWGANVPVLPSFFVSNRGNATGGTNYHPGVSGSIIPRLVVADPPLAFWFSGNPIYHSGGRGLVLDKMDATDSLPHAFSWAVSGDPKWGFGMDAATNTGSGNADWVAIFDYKAQNGTGADMLRGCPSDATAYGCNMWNWGAAGAGSPRGNAYFLTLSSYYGPSMNGYGLGGLNILTSGGLGLLVQPLGGASAAAFQGAVTAGATTLSSLSVTGNAGFFNAAATSQPTVTGACNGNPALRSALKGLSALGLVADSTQTTDPTVPAWSWVNQGSASVAAANGTVFLQCPAASGDSLKLRVIPSASGSYTITMGFLPAMVFANFLAVGLCLYDSNSGKVITFQLIGNSVKDANEQVILASKWTTTTAFSADYTMLVSPTRAPAWQAGANMWFQIQDDGATRHYRVSNDGVNFVELLSTTSSDFLTLTHVGLFVNPSNTFWGAGMNVVSWLKQ